MTTVVTSFSPTGLVEYGRRMMDTFAAYWPEDVRLIAYVEAPCSADRVKMRDLFALPELRAFLDRHGRSRLAAGREIRPDWKPKDRERGYCYRYDALKFCRKIFALADAARLAEAAGEEIIVWLDADVVTRAPIRPKFVDDLLGVADVAFLGRAPAHSECGFVAYRLPACLGLIEGIERLYAEDYVFGLSEWHDSYLFDFVRHNMPELVQRDLTPGGFGHVWMTSPLYPLMDHLKGERKKVGSSLMGVPR